MTAFLYRFLLCALLSGAGTVALAASQGITDNSGEEQRSAHEVVKSATSRVMSTLEEAQDYAGDNPQRYYDQLHDILDPIIDYRGFARGVMGPYASSERYYSLDEEGRAQLREQLERFTEVIRAGLIRTYGKGLLAFAGSRVELSQPSENPGNEDRAQVRQLIRSDGAQPYVVTYHMGRAGSGEWKLRNVVIESVNLGQIYQNQFQAAARKHDGDLDKVIANWSTQELET